MKFRAVGKLKTKDNILGTDQLRGRMYCGALHLDHVHILWIRLGKTIGNILNTNSVKPGTKPVFGG